MKSMIRARDGASAGDAVDGARTSLETKLKTCKQALAEMTAERDRLTGEIERRRRAFETTAIDRDIHKRNAIDWKRAVMAFLESDAFKRAPAIDKPRRDPLPRSHGRGLPNVLCVGVQKSATSFLYSIIRNHPKIAVYPKDRGLLRKLHETDSASNYEEMAANIDDTLPAIAQFEVAYIDYGGSGIETIKKHLCKNPRIIISVRGPVDRLISEYKMRLRTILWDGTFVETHDFEDALQMEQYRAVNNPREYLLHFSYKERSLYSEKIRAYIKAFGRENVHVVVMEEDLSQDTCGAIANLFDFLSLFDSDGFRLSILPHNEYRDITRAPSEIEVIFHLANGHRLHDPVGMEEVGGEDVVRLEVRSNVPAQLDISHDDPRPELLASAIHLKRRLNYEPSRDEKKRLFNTHFRDDVARLEELLGRDLSVWYAGYDDAAGSMPRRRTS